MEKKSIYTFVFSILAVSQLIWFFISFFVRSFFTRLTNDIEKLNVKIDNLQCNENAKKIAQLEERISKK